MQRCSRLSVVAAIDVWSHQELTLLLKGLLGSVKKLRNVRLSVRLWAGPVLEAAEKVIRAQTLAHMAATEHVRPLLARPNHPSHVAAVSLTVLHTAHEEYFHVSILLCNQPRPL